MREVLIAPIVCAVMVSAIALTGAVSARPAGKSDVRQYDVISAITGLLAGKLTVNLATGHYVFAANYERSNTKDVAKGDAGLNAVIQATSSGAPPL